MEVILQQIIEHAKESYFLHFFLVGSLGSFFFDLTLFFNKDLGLLAAKKGIKPFPGQNIIFIFCNTLCSACLGGIMAIWVNHSLWLAFFAGFLHSIFFVFIVKTLLLNSMEKAFWVTIGKICVSILLNPSKNFVTVLENLTTKNENGGNK